MAITVGAVDIAVRAALGDFRRDLARETAAAADEAGGKAGTSFSQKFSKAAGAALAGTFALATKGALDLDTATRGAAAAAGIAESQMGAFRSQVVELFKANPSKGFEEIARTVGAVKTDLGLTGEAAARATQQFLDFSKITGQDTPTAVRGLADVLDAYSLEASESGRVMDLLVASNQKYGGSISAAQEALRAIGPQLRAMNLGVEEGVGFLNAFEASGLNANQALAALRVAVTKLKPGQDLNDLIAQVAAIEDPTLRAQKAIELFGARGGAVIANLKGLNEGLGAYQISMAEAADATTKSADIVDDSFQNKITKRIREFISGPLAELGTEAGPVLTALAGISSLTIAVRGLGDVFDALKIKALAGWAAVAAAPIAPAVILEGFKNPINEFLTGLGGIGDAWGRVQGVVSNSPGLLKGQEALAGAASEATALAQEARNLARGLATVGPAVATTTTQVVSAFEGQLRPAFDEMAAQALGKWRETAESGPEALRAALPGLLKDATTTAAILPAAIRAGIKPVRLYSEAMAIAHHDGIVAKRQLALDAWNRMVEDQKLAQMRGVTLAGLLGALQSTELQRGIKSKAQGSVDLAAATVNAIAGVLGTLGSTAYKVGANALANLKAGMTRGEPEAVAISRTIAEAIASPFAGFGSLDAQVAALIGQIKSYGATAAPAATTTDSLAAALGLADAAAAKAAGSTKAKAGADKEASAAAKEHADTLKGRLTEALRTARDAALDGFSRIHDANIKAIRGSRERTQEEIDGARQRIRAHLDEVRAKAEAPITEAEASQRAIEDDRRLRDINESIADAQARLSEAQAGRLDATTGQVTVDPAAVESANRALRSATDSLQGFGAQQGIEALRATAKAAVTIAEETARREEAALKLREAAADTAAATATTKENDRFEDQKLAFDRAFDALSTHLTKGKAKHEEIQGQVTALYERFNLTGKALGAAFGAEYAAGIIASRSAVADAAAELAEVIKRNLKTASPAQEGPLHDNPPDVMGRALGLGFGGGVAGGVRDALPEIRRSIATVADLFKMPVLTATMPTLTASPALAYAAAATTSGYSGPTGRAAPQAAAGTHIGEINVYNPKPEVGSESLEERLRLVARYGVF